MIVKAVIFLIAAAYLVIVDKGSKMLRRNIVVRLVGVTSLLLSIVIILDFFFTGFIGGFIKLLFILLVVYIVYKQIRRYVDKVSNEGFDSYVSDTNGIDESELANEQEIYERGFDGLVEDYSYVKDSNGEIIGDIDEYEQRKEEESRKRELIEKRKQEKEKLKDLPNQLKSKILSKKTGTDNNEAGQDTIKPEKETKKDKEDLSDEFDFDFNFDDDFFD